MEVVSVVAWSVACLVVKEGKQEGMKHYMALCEPRVLHREERLLVEVEFFQGQTFSVKWLLQCNRL